VSAHPLLTFAVITCAVTWSTWAGVVRLGGDLWELAGLAGLFAPAWAALLVTRAGDTATRTRRGRVGWLATAAVWLVSTGVFTVYVAVTSGPPPPAAVVVYAVIALLPTGVAASVWSTSTSVRRMVSSLRHPRGAVGWYAVALLLPPAVLVAGEQLTRLMGEPVLWSPAPPPAGTSLPAFAAASFAYTLLFAGGLNEETGWTGLALPRLLRRFSPAVASILLWALWITWHLPFHFSGHWNADTLSFEVALVTTFLARFLFTWLYLRTEGGLWTALLFHTSANVAFGLIPATWAAIGLYGLLALVAVITARMWAPRLATHGDPV